MRMTERFMRVYALHVLLYFLFQSFSWEKLRDDSYCQHR